MKNILIALDGSPAAKSVLEQGVELARSMDGTLTLFRAVGVPAEMPSIAFVQSQEDLRKTMEDNARRDLEELARTVPKELLSGIRIGLGSPWQAICEAAGDAKSGILVIGSHGYGVLDRILGTTASKVVNHAPCAVLVVRPR